MLEAEAVVAWLCEQGAQAGSSLLSAVTLDLRTLGMPPLSFSLGFSDSTEARV